MQVRHKKIYLKDGSTLDKNEYGQYNQRSGTIVRFRNGKMALMRIDNVEEDVHGFRLSGMNILGESHGAYAHDCVILTNKEREIWDYYSTSRRGSYLSDRYESKGA